MRRLPCASLSKQLSNVDFLNTAPTIWFSAESASRRRRWSALCRSADAGAPGRRDLGVAVGALTKVGADHVDMMTDAPLASGDGLNYMNKRTSVGIGVNTVQKIRRG